MEPTDGIAYTLAIDLNLYMVCENCDINPKRSRLPPSVTEVKAGLKVGTLASTSTDIQFANGTGVNTSKEYAHWTCQDLEEGNWIP